MNSGAFGGAPADLLYDPGLGRFLGTGVPAGAVTLDALLGMLVGNDAFTFTAGLSRPEDAPFSAARGTQPLRFSVTRKAQFPVACTGPGENYAEQLADFSRAVDSSVPLRMFAANLDPTAARVLVNGTPMGAAPVQTAPFTFTWTLDAVPAIGDTLVFQLQNPGGMMSNEVPALVIDGP